MLDTVGTTVIEVDQVDIKAMEEPQRLDFALEIAELEISVSGRLQSDVDFETAVRTSVLASKNDFLFSFPASRFALDAVNVAAVRLISDDSVLIAYIYETANAEIFAVPSWELDPSYGDLAENYVDILCALEPAIMELRHSRELH